MPKMNIRDIESRTGTSYPAPFGEVHVGRSNKSLASAAGLTQFGINLTRLAPGAWSSQRHWHSHDDEFVYMLEGEAVLVTDEGETVMRAGDFAGFPAGVANGHCMKNRSTNDAVFLVAGSRHPQDEGNYSDIDLKCPRGRYSGDLRYTRKDGTPY